MSLIDFLLKICDVNSGVIHFVRRGNTIEKHFVALWPCHCFLAARAGEIMMDMHSNIKICVDELLESRFDFGQVGAIASGLIETVSRYADSPQAYAFQKGLQELKREYDEIRAFPRNRMVGYQLSNFGNLISVVFQNVLPSEQNVLFLGDFGKPKHLWEMIEGNCDGMVGMHTTYRDIKIPHHGTTAYYHSFVKYFSADKNSPTTIYIPNGCHRRATWNIDRRYSDDVTRVPCTVSQCTNNDTCNAATPNCQCLRRNIVHPRDAI